jgi:hypothetical protein
LIFHEITSKLEEENNKEADMQKWEIRVFVGHNAGMDPSKFWKKKDKDGKSEFDYLRSMGAEGWEPVSATPVNVGGTTSEVMFTFKRPLE